MGVMRKQITEWKNEYIELQVALHLDDVQCDLTTMQTRENRVAVITKAVGDAIADEWDKEVMEKVKEIGVYASGIQYDPIEE